VPLLVAACADSPEGSGVGSGLDANDPDTGVDATTLAPDGPASDGDASFPSENGGDATSEATPDAPPDASPDATTSGGDADDGSSSDAARDGTTADASPPPYAPCPPPGSPCRIMPLGDSITYGYASSDFGGYRKPLFQKTLSAHQAITFVGSQTSGPTMVGGVPFPQNNEGHSGYTIDTGGGRSGILPLVQQGAIQTYAPHIVTLMIGTNDVDIQLDLANAPMRLATLIDAILAADSRLLLVVAQIIPTQDDTENTRVVAYNAAIPSIVQARAQQGKHILLVDMYGPIVADASFKTDYLANNLHPNDAGFVVLADVWYAAIGSFFH
jgi:lysophospholipase L1-like esterase